MIPISVDCHTVSSLENACHVLWMIHLGSVYLVITLMSYWANIPAVTTPVVSRCRAFSSGDLFSQSTMQIKHPFCKLMRGVTETREPVRDRSTEGLEMSCHLQQGHAAAESTSNPVTQSLSSSLHSSSCILQLIGEQCLFSSSVFSLLSHIHHWQKVRGIWLSVEMYGKGKTFMLQ